MGMLRYADELRNADKYFDELPATKPDKELVDLAVELISRKASPFDASKFEDHYGTALKALIQDKLKGRRIIAYAEDGRPSGAKVVDLMDALRKSVSGDDGGKGSAKSKHRPKAKPSPQRAS